MYKCNKCDFISQNKVYFTSHMKCHEDRKIESNITNKRPCSYFRSKNGCRKGNNCDFDHSEAAQAKPVIKVPKLCKNGETCGWTPQCRYVHSENGEVLPSRSVGKGIGEVRTQGFGPQDWSRQPPGWTSLSPPAPSAAPPPPPTQATMISEGEQERRTKVIQEFIQIIIPNLMCLTEFPNLGRNQNKRN